MDQAELLRRTFGFDVFACVRGGGRRRVWAYVTAPGGVRAILEHLGRTSLLGVGSTEGGGQPRLEAAGIEAAKAGSAPTRGQRHTPRFPSENGAPICPGESMRVRSFWSFFGPLGPVTGRQKASTPPLMLASDADALAY